MGIYTKKVMVVFGTRPEAIKMCPLVKELKSKEEFNTIVCVTGQHREMLDQVLNAFNVIPDFDLNIMTEKQDLFDITSNILLNMKRVLESTKPDILLVHGDTSTTFAATLAAYYLKIPVGHVEAGLRTYNIYSPFPEEFNRQATSLISTYHFAPTQLSKQNLVNEGISIGQIYVTGNTAIDALKTTIINNYKSSYLDWVGNSKLIMLTAHRRENLGEPLKNIFRALLRIVNEYEDIKVIYPIHKNPLIRKLAEDIFRDSDRIKIIEPLDVIDFHNFLNKSHVILTDSGGIQEEAPSLGKPVLVVRDTTERPEGVEAGTLKLVGTNENSIYNNLKLLITDTKVYESMSKASNPYGDGYACKRIVEILIEKILF